MTEQLALDLDVSPAHGAPATCVDCDAPLTDADRRQWRSRCTPCRERRALDLAAERDWRTAPRAAPCRCSSPLVLADALDEGARCAACGRATSEREAVAV